MQFFITFLEGIISFISPCMLPMRPLYVSYFAGGGETRRRVWPRALAFVLGFTAVFCLLGVFAGTLGAFLVRYSTAVNLVCGALVVLFGLGYLEIIPLTFLRGMEKTVEVRGFFSAMLFGVIYSVSLTPCVGAFLGSAIMLASTSGSALKGLLLLLVYSLGLGIPFVLTALTLDRLKNVFGFIKKHYRVVNIVCGVFLILVGILMMTGLMGRFVTAG